MKAVWLIAVIAAGVLLGWSASRWLPTEKPPFISSEAPRGGDFVLDAAHGPFELRQQRGKVVLIFFGYTFCPDICPTNLSLITQAFNALSEDELQRVQGVFISVDPARDSVARLQEYTGYFHPSIAGVTGKPDTVARIAAQYGASYHKVEGESQGGYLVDHSSNTFVVAADGTLSQTLPHATAPQKILETIRGLLSPAKPLD